VFRFLADRRRVKRWLLALCFGAGFATAAALSASAQENPPLDLLGADHPRVIPLGQVAGGERTGVLTLMLANHSAHALKLTVTYLRQDGAPPMAVARKPTPSGGITVSFAHTPAKTLKSGDVQPIALRFRKKVGIDPSHLAGLLVITPSPAAKPKTPPTATPTPGTTTADPPATTAPAPTTTGSTAATSSSVAAQSAPTTTENTPDGTLVVPVTAELTAPPGLKLQPAAVILHPVAWWPFSGATAGRTASVDLTGAVAKKLLGTSGALDGRVKLVDGSGHAVDVGWRVEEVNGRRGRLKVAVLGQPAPGSYSGTLPLIDGVDQPQVGVTVKARHAFIWPLLAIVLGAVLGTLIPQLGSLARRKDLLRASLQASIQEYQKRRGETGTPPASYSLDDYLGPATAPWNERRWLPLPRLYGAAGLFSSIYWARNKDDLDNATAWADEMLDRIGWWIDVERHAGPLAALLNEQMPSIHDHSWDAQALLRDSRLVLQAASHAPADGKAADALVQSLSQQLELHQDIVAAWRDVAAAEDASDALIERLLKLTNPEVRPGDRTSQQFDDAVVEAKELSAEAAKKPVADGLRDGAKGRAKGGASWGAFKRVGSVLGPAWDTFNTLLPGGSRSPVQVIRSVQQRDWALTALAVLLASVAYLATIYDDTYGSPSDYLAAFAAGFGAHAVINWAVLPIFESLQVRAKSSTGDTAGATDALAAPSRPLPAGPTSDGAGDPATPAAN
jgi:hypothetical protein